MSGDQHEKSGIDKIPEKKDENLEPVTDQLSTKIPEIDIEERTPTEKRWWRFLAIIFAPMAIGEILLRSTYGQRLWDFLDENDNDDEKSWGKKLGIIVLKWLDRFLKVIFWPERLVEAFPQHKGIIRAIHFLFWVVVLAAVIPVLFGTPAFFALFALPFLSAAHVFSTLVAMAYVGGRMFLRNKVYPINVSEEIWLDSGNVYKKSPLSEPDSPKTTPGPFWPAEPPSPPKPRTSVSAIDEQAKWGGWTYKQENPAQTVKEIKHGSKEESVPRAPLIEKKQEQETLVGSASRLLKSKEQSDIPSQPDKSSTDEVDKPDVKGQTPQG